MAQNKRFPALLLAIALLVALAPQAYFLMRADADTSGKCGDDLRWSVADGVLTITGSGETYNYWAEGWHNFGGYFSTGSDVYNDYDQEVTTILTPEGMTLIKEKDFISLYDVESITIPNPSCAIADSEKTLRGPASGHVTIYGHSGSTAEAYAKKYSDYYTFLSMDKPLFEDVPKESYYTEAVTWAVGKGITNGTSDTTFSPDKSCTRAEVVTFLWRAAGKPDPKSGGNPFADVAGGKYYSDAVLWAVEKGITNGVSLDEFAPDRVCTRGQIVTFLWRYKNKPLAAGAVNPFEDVPKDIYYYDAVLWAVKNGVTKGVDDTHFNPDQSCSRAQVVTFLHRAKNLPAATEFQAVVTADKDYVDVDASDKTTLTVKVSGGTAPYKYEWQVYSTEYEMWTGLLSATESSYVTTKGGNFRCQVTDANGSVTLSDPVYIQPRNG